MEKEYLGKHLFKTVNKMRRVLDKVNQKKQLSMGQARLLRYIHDASNEGQPIYQSDLEKVLGLRGASVTGMLDMLAKQALIIRKEDLIDKRRKKIELTTLGKEKAAEAYESILTFEKKLEDLFKKEEYEEIVQYLKRIESWLDLEEQEDEETI